MNVSTKIIACCVVDLHAIDGWISSLVTMVEANVFGQGTLVCLVDLQVLLVPFGGAIVAGVACLPVMP